MQLNNETKQLKPYHGIAVFAIVILMTIFVAAPIQMKLGMHGVAITEILLLLLGLIPAILFKTDLREVFPIKKPLFRQIIGTLVIWLGTYLAVILVTLIIGYFFPEGLGQVSNGMQNTFTSVPMGIAFIIIAIMPAVCEEALHRGFILYSFYYLKNKWSIIICMGIIFGIFHLDVYRFLPTAILGAAMTYIMIETKNILLPALLHFFNNGLTTFVSFTGVSQTAAGPASFAVPLNAVGAYLIIGAVIPFVLLLGARLIPNKELKRNEENALGGKRRISKKVWAVVLCSVIMFIAGVAVTGLSMNDAPVFHTSITQSVNCDSKDIEFLMKIDKSGQYTMDLELAGERGLVAMKIMDEDGEEAYNTSCMQMTSSGPLKLEEGTYRVIVEFHIDDIEEYCKQVGITYDEKMKQELKMTGDLSEYTPFKLKLVIR